MRTFFSNVASGAVGGLIGGLLLLLGAAIMANTISDVALDANPTCDSPRGLTALKMSDAFSVETGSALARDAAATYVPQNAFDSWGGSIWVPPFRSKGRPGQEVPEFIREKSVVTVKFNKPQDVKLVCVVNGLANAFPNYQSWARVRTLSVWADERGTQSITLKSLGADDFPNAQYAGRDFGSVSRMHIRIVDAYPGLTVESFDPDVCLRKAPTTPPEMLEQPRYEAGCLVSPSPRAGLSEIYFFVPTEEQPLSPR